MEGLCTSCHHKWYTAKTRSFGLHFCHRKFRYIFLNHFYALQCTPKATEFTEITQTKGNYAVQGHSWSPILVPIKSSCDFLLVINTNLPPMLHCFGSIGPKSLYLDTPLVFNSPDRGFPWDDLCQFFCGCQLMTKVPNAIEILRKISTGWVECTSVTDNQTTDGWATAYSEREREFTFAKNCIISSPIDRPSK